MQKICCPECGAILKYIRIVKSAILTCSNRKCKEFGTSFAEEDD